MRSSPRVRHAGSLSSAVLFEPLESRAYCAVDVAAAVAFVSPASGQVKPGQRFTVSVEIVNDGTAELNDKRLPVSLGVSTSPDGSAATTEGTVFHSVRLAPGSHTTFRVTKAVPKGFALGTYYPVADADPSDLLGDTDLANNVAVGTGGLTVISPYPDINGTWVGSGRITKGEGKGLTLTQTDVYTENPATGTFTLTGTRRLSDGSVYALSGEGSISTTGVFADGGGYASPSLSGQFASRGHLAHQRLTITFRNSLDSGTLTLLPEVT